MTDPLSKDSKRFTLKPGKKKTIASMGSTWEYYPRDKVVYRQKGERIYSNNSYLNDRTNYYITFYDDYDSAYGTSSKPIDTGLSAIVEKGDIENLKKAISNGGDVNEVDGSGYTPLIRASKEGHTEMVKLLLEANADVNRGDDIIGSNPLSWASSKGHTEIVKLLLEANADVNARSKYYYTALHNASIGGHTEIVKLLLEANAEVNSSNDGGATPLLNASKNSSTEIVKLLLEANADVNLSNNNGWTPLHYASYNGDTEIVKLLLEANADVNAGASGDIGTPLSKALEKGHSGIIEILKKYGAKEKI